MYLSRSRSGYLENNNYNSRVLEPSTALMKSELHVQPSYPVSTTYSQVHSANRKEGLFSWAFDEPFMKKPFTVESRVSENPSTVESTCIVETTEEVPLATTEYVMPYPSYRSAASLATSYSVAAPLTRSYNMRAPLVQSRILPQPLERSYVTPIISNFESSPYRTLPKRELSEEKLRTKNN